MIVELRVTIWAMNTDSKSFEDLQMRILNFEEKTQSSQVNIEFKIVIDTSLNDYRWSSETRMNIYETNREAIKC